MKILVLTLLVLPVLAGVSIVPAFAWNEHGDCLIVDTAVTKIPRLTREDAPFGPNMTDYDLWKLFLVPEIAAIDKSKFPSNQSLKDILKNDTRIRRFKPGEVIVREGDYGNSAFLVLNGKLRVVLSPGLPDYLSGQKPPS